MCGFCVSTGPRPPGATAIEAVLASRGPDGRGEVEDGNGWLLHRRLAVIDPSDRSAQPFVVPDGSGHVAYNGEIYNFRQLRDRLELATSTDGDTEVFAQVLSRSDRVPGLRGMYAGAMVKEGELRLTRDRFGIKPLYRVRTDSGHLAAGSQLRCLTSFQTSPTIDMNAVACFLQFGNVHGTTMFEGVTEVRPGTTEVWVGGELDSVVALPPAQGEGDLRAALEHSVQRHLVADVDIAVLLSAGLDSAVVALLAAQQGASPVAVTLAAVEGWDESGMAAETARRLGLRHEVVTTSEQEALEAVEGFLGSMDQPSIDGFNTYLVSRAVNRLGIRVALSGLGADELFGGYSSFRRAYRTYRLRNLPAPILRMAVKSQGANAAKVDQWVAARHDLGQLASITREVFSPDEVRRLCGRTFDPALPELPGADPVTRSEVWRYMSPMLLRDSDSASMASSVELRVPFLDDEVVAAALSRTPKKRALEGKHAVARAIGSPLLDEILARPKTGFELPMGRWIAGSLAPHLQRALDSRSALSEVVDVETARALCKAGPWSRGWALVVLNTWLEHNG